MSINSLVDLVGQLVVAGVTLGFISIVILFALRRSSASLRVLGYTVTLLVHTLLFGLMSSAQLHTLMQPGDTPAPYSPVEVTTIPTSTATLPSRPQKLKIDLQQNHTVDDSPTISLKPQSSPSSFIEVPAALSVPLSIFGHIWGAVTLFLLGYWIRQSFQLQKTIKAATPITTEVSTPHKNTRILLSESKNTAFCCGILKPSIVISKDLYERLPKEERDLIIDHEMAHLGAGDAYLIQIQFFAAALFWWLPTTWILGQRLITACEQRCDSVVLQSGAPSKLYAELLLKVAALSSSPPLRNSLPISRKYHETKKRIKKIMNNHTPHTPISSRQKWVSTAVTILITASIFSLCGQLTIADEQSQKVPYTEAITSAPDKSVKTKETPVTQPTPDLAVQCDGGISFDTKTNTLIYRGNVILSYQSEAITLTAKDGVTAYLGKTPANLQMPEEIGVKNYKDMSMIIAKGDVRVSYRGNDDKVIIATSENVIYDNNKRTITLKGGFPSIKEGSSILKATKANQHITISLDGAITTSGGVWKQEFALPAARNLLLEGGPWSSSGAGSEGGERGVEEHRRVAR
jgi:beta-lactamase regulating signal transducer with metallopeptidase domain/lipopolysaccharide export system protein LptA